MPINLRYLPQCTPQPFLRFLFPCLVEDWLPALFPLDELVDCIRVRQRHSIRGPELFFKVLWWGFRGNMFEMIDAFCLGEVAVHGHVSAKFASEGLYIHIVGVEQVGK